MWHLKNGIVYSSENEWTTTACNNMDEFFKSVEWKNADTNEDILYDAVYTKFTNRQV